MQYTKWIIIFLRRGYKYLKLPCYLLYDSIFVNLKFDDSPQTICMTFFKPDKPLNGTSKTIELIVLGRAKFPKLISQRNFTLKIGSYLQHVSTVTLLRWNLLKVIRLRFYEGHSVNSEIRYVSAIAYLLAESWCCLYKAPTFISHNTKETIS